MNLVNTPYDDVFRTLLNDCSSLIIPVINEIFGEHYTGSEQIRFLPNEHFMNKQGGEEQERITDSNFVIESCDHNVKSKNYHMECQSTADDSMLVRIFEYATQIALDNGEIKDNTLTVRFPNSAVLFLRSDRKTPDRLDMRIETPGGNINYGIPIMKLQEYSIDDIFNKNLLFLIPFHIFHHEKRLPEYNVDAAKLDRLRSEYEKIKNKLEDLCKDKKIDEYTKCTIMDMSTKVLEHIARKYDNVRKGVQSVMGGKVLEYEAKAIRNEGRSQGLAEGRNQGLAEGRADLCMELIHTGKMTLKEAAGILNKKVDAVKAQYNKKYGIVQDRNITDRLNTYNDGIRRERNEESNHRDAHNISR